MRRCRGAALALALVAGPALGGCRFAAPDVAVVPDHPTFVADVLPVLDDHCTLCHGEPRSHGAPDYFRLDRYAPADGIQGAVGLADEIVRRVRTGDMPPAAAWGDGVGPHGVELLQRWLDQGSVER